MVCMNDHKTVSDASEMGDKKAGDRDTQPTATQDERAQACVTKHTTRAVVNYTRRETVRVQEGANLTASLLIDTLLGNKSNTFAGRPITVRDTRIC